MAEGQAPPATSGARVAGRSLIPPLPCAACAPTASWATDVSYMACTVVHLLSASSFRAALSCWPSRLRASSPLA